MSSGGDHPESDAYRPLEAGANGDGEPVTDPKQNNDAKVTSPAVETPHQGDGESFRAVDGNESFEIQNNQNDGENVDNLQVAIDNSLSDDNEAEGDQNLVQVFDPNARIEIESSGNNSVTEDESNVTEFADNSFQSADSQVNVATSAEMPYTSNTVDRDTIEPESRENHDAQTHGIIDQQSDSTLSAELDNIPRASADDSENVKDKVLEDHDGDGDGLKHGQAHFLESLQNSAPSDDENQPFGNQNINVNHPDTAHSLDQDEEQQQQAYDNDKLSHEHDKYQPVQHSPPHPHSHASSNSIEAANKHSIISGPERDAGDPTLELASQEPGDPTTDTGPQPTESSQSLYSFADSLDGQVDQPNERYNAVVGEEDGFCKTPSQNDSVNVSSNPDTQSQNRNGTVSSHPEYPVNYNNYKVCRHIEPGVKECLILETGEQVTCRKGKDGSQFTSECGEGDPGETDQDIKNRQSQSESAEDISKKNGTKDEKSTNSSDSETTENKVSSVPEETPERMRSPNGSVKTESALIKVSSNFSTKEVPQEYSKGKGSQISEPASPTAKAGFKIVHKSREGALTFGNLNLSRSPGLPGKESNRTDEGDKSENALESPKHRSASESSSSKEIQRDMNRSQRSVSDRSSIGDRNEVDAVGGYRNEVDAVGGYRNGVAAVAGYRYEVETLAGLDTCNQDDVYRVYETESDLRNFTEPQPAYRYVGSAERTNQNVSAESPFRRSARLDNHVAQNYISDQPPLTSTRTEPSTSDKIDMSALYRAERWLDDRSAPVSPRRQNLSTSVSSTGSGPIPGFRTLQEQQASWMKMFKLLEDQHQTDLVTQYKQHQRNIHNLQDQIENDLCRQQDSFQKKLDVHREIMLQNASFAGSYLPTDVDAEGMRVEDETRFKLGQSSLPRPIIPEDEEMPDNFAGDTSLVTDDSEFEDDVPEHSARRSLENSFVERTPRGLHTLSTIRHVDSVYNSSVNRSTGEQRTPSRIRNGNSDDGHLNDSYHSSSHSIRRNTRASPHYDLLDMPSYLEEANCSSNAYGSLREKHSNHLADLRSYYEQELSELKAALTTPEFIKSQSPYKKVMEENLQLHSQFEVQEDQLKAFKRTNREQDNKIKTLQIRLDDTLQMYEESQSAISTLRHHADELRVHCKESDIRAKDLEVENIKLSTALQEAYKMNEQQSTEAKRTDSALKRLTERHENLHRENESNKEALNQMDGKLYDCRMEIVQLKRLVSKLELETTRLSRENNNLRHKGLVSSLGLSTFYPGNPGDSFSTPTSAFKTVHNSLLASSPELSDATLPEEQLESDYSVDYNSTPLHEPYQSANGSVRDTYRSPLMKAEEDLQMLRRTVKENLGQSLAHQRAIPRSSSSPAKMNKLDTPRKSGGTKSPRYSNKKYSPESITPLGQTRNGLSAQPVTIIDSLLSRSTPRKNNTDFNSHFPSADTPTRFDVSVRRSPNNRGESSAKKRSPMSKKDKINVNGKNNTTDDALERVVENTLEKVRAGEFVTRPTWENRDTTTVKSNKSQLRPKVREEKIQERVQTIHDLEHRYDHLQGEKRELESALSRVPLSGKIKHHYRTDKEELDNKLDKVEKELGSVRMSLKRYNVLKTSGH